MKNGEFDLQGDQNNTVLIGILSGRMLHIDHLNPD